MEIGGIITLTAVGLSILGTAIWALVDWFKKAPDFKVGAVGVKYVDGASEVPGIREYIQAMTDVHIAEGTDPGDYHVWVFPLDAENGDLNARLANDSRTITGTVVQLSLIGGLTSRRTVRIRNLERPSGVLGTALGHELAWHVVPFETGKGWNQDHSLDGDPLENKYDARYRELIGASG
jgi:hypothetical protein